MMRVTTCVASAVLAFAALGSARAESVRPQDAAANFRLPYAIVPNVGQFDERAKFVAKDGGMTAFFTNDGIALSLARKGGVGAAVGFRFEGAGAEEIEGVDLVNGTFNWFVGSDPADWRTGVPGYQGVRMHEVWPGVDVHAWTKDGVLEYDFECARQCDVSAVVLAIDGAEEVAVSDDGALAITTAAGVLRQDAPRVFAVAADGARREIECKVLALGGDRFSFAIEECAADERVVVDPAIQYSTYLGGSGDDEVFGVAVNSLGEAYLTGTTPSANFPITPGAFDSTLGFDDAFVVKLNSTGTGAFVSTYLGGGVSEDGGLDIALDSSNNVFVVGYAQGTILGADFPTTPGALDTVHSGSTNVDGFVAKFNSSISALSYSTYLGGSLTYVNGVAISPTDGTAYVTGTTTDTLFPVTAGAFDTTFGGGVFATDAFVTHLNSTGTGLSYSAYIGSTSSEVCKDIAVDSSGNAYVCGFALSPGFAGSGGAIDPTCDGAFVLGVNSTGSTRTFATGLGVAVEATGIAVSGSDLVVTGGTPTGLAVTATAFDTAFNGGTEDGYVAKINNLGTVLKYATYLGGSSTDRGLDVAVDARGNAIVIGGTTSGNFPVTPGAPDSTFSGSSDLFIAKLDPKGEVLMYSSYLGGSTDEFLIPPNGLTTGPAAIATDSGEAAYAVGLTTSVNFPVTAGAFDTASNGAHDGFATKAATRSCVANAASSMYGSGKAGTFGVPVLDSVNLPYIGATTSVRITNGKPGAPSLMFLGIAPLALPFDGGTLLVNPTLVINLPPFDGAGTLMLTATIADDPTFCGVAIYHQVMFADPGAVGFHHTAQTNGLVRTLGS